MSLSMWSKSMVTKECLYYLTFHSSLMHRFVVLVNFMVVLYSPAVAMPSIDAKTVTTSDHPMLPSPTQGDHQPPNAIPYH